ncbi:MAG: hypothetical protein K5894_09515 [Lachnospiraceae bacterium]|nr:hypothetical protein [Lachnospiraceae bacterium]
MNYFSLDNRKEEDILREVKKLANSYLPEWRYEVDDREDPGAVLVKIFAEMYGGILDRLNEVPERFYYEYLNILGVEESQPVAAEGLVYFGVPELVEDLVRVPENTLLYINNDDEHIVYETTQAIDAASNELKNVFYVSPGDNRIESLDFNEPESFFVKGKHENIQKHKFTIFQNEIFNLSGKAEFILSVVAATEHIKNEVLSHLTDKEHVRWFYKTEDGEEEIKDPEIGSGNIILKKKTDKAIIANDDGSYSLSCEMTGRWGNFHLDGMKVSGSSVEKIHADELYNGEFPITRGSGGYCFGRIPAPYEEFYIKCDSAFNKKGAEINLVFDLDIITYSAFDNTGIQYNYGENIIDKNAAVALKTDNVYVNEVVWEYFNGTGWNYLEAKGTKNPFSGQNDGALEVRFIIPEDIEETEINSRIGYYLRARVVSVENAYSARPVWLLPFVKDVTINWHYSSYIIPQEFEIENNAEKENIRDWDGKSAVRLDIYSDIESQVPAIYMCFERPLQGLPFSMMFDLENNSMLNEQLRYEIWTGKRFDLVHVIDNTDNLEHSGPVYFYFNLPSEEGRFFGKTGYWLKLSAGQKPLKSVNFCPLVKNIFMNVTKVIQRRHAEEEVFSNDSYDKNKKIYLLNKPVLDLEVWVNESDSIKTETVNELEKNHPELIRKEENEDGEISYWIKWKRVRESDTIGENDRIYRLDPYSAEITFGDGKYGKIVPEGFENIRVSYNYGGGVQGNAGIDVDTNFLIPVPRIDTIFNITPKGGGMGQAGKERLLNYGKYRIRHQNRAVGINDYDNMIYEHFGNISHVKSFDGIDCDGRKATGYVTVVISGMLDESDNTDKELCSKVKNFLSERSDCTMISSGRLNVIAAIQIEISADVSVVINNPEEAAATQQKIKDTIKLLIDEKWASREIGDQIRINEVYKSLKAIRNIKTIRKIIFEGSWYENGRRMIAPIEADTEFMFAIVKSGEHRVTIEI